MPRCLESHQRYAKLLAAWMATGKVPPKDETSLGLDPGLQPDGTQDTNHPLYGADPHVAYRWDPGSGQQWRYP